MAAAGLGFVQEVVWLGKGPPERAAAARIGQCRKLFRERARQRARLDSFQLTSIIL
jgi:hypothetical protein